MMRAYYAMALSFAGLVVAWWGASGTARNGPLTAYLVLGLVSTAVATATGAAFCASGRAAIRSRRRSIEGDLAGALARLVQPEADPDSISPALPLPMDEFVAIGGGTRYHRFGCALVASKTVTYGSRADHESAGRRSCGMCEP